MAKSKNKQLQPQLSPESYIRQKARNLPVYECWINDNWESAGEASIIVSRIHTNGHFTFGVYLVDLLCLGTKDTFYNFNVDTEMYEEMLEKMGGDNFEKISYVLAHNIIFAANEFAEDLGFKPHKDFNSITRYILEEDTEDIELMEIECGRDGKPMYVASEYDSPQRVQQITNQLLKTAGEGKFVVKMEDEMYDDDEMDDEFPNMDQLKENFIRLTNKNINKISQKERSELVDIIDEIFCEICDNEIVDELLDEWCDETQIEITNNFGTEQLGIDPDILSEQEYESFEKVMELALDKSDKYKKEIKKMREKWGDLPFFGMLDLTFTNENDTDEYARLVNELYLKFPDYTYFKLLKYQSEIPGHKSDFQKVISLNDFYSNVENITLQEMILFLQLKTMIVVYNNDKNELEAMFTHLDDFDLDENIIADLKSYLVLGRHKFLCDYFNIPYGLS